MDEHPAVEQPEEPAAPDQPVTPSWPEGAPAAAQPAPASPWTAGQPTAPMPAASPTPPAGVPSTPPGMPPPVPPYGGASPYGGSPYGQVPPYGWPGWGPAPSPPPRPGRGVVALAVALGVLLAAAAGSLVGHEIWRAETSPQSGVSLVPNPSAAPSTGGAGPQDAAAIATHVDPGLVDINTQIDAQGLEGAGTGMVLTSSGEVLTNNHVIEGAGKISVTDVGNGRTYSAQVVGYDRAHDIAVLQLTGASGLQTVSIGDSSKLNVGQGVVAIGNANGTGGTPTYAGGTVTALGQTITASDQADGSSEQLTGLIQTNADIVSGDSGGPLVDASGKVVGIDTAASGGYQFRTSGSQGYAIPINQAMAVARQIESGTTTGTVHIGPTALLGVEVRASGAGGLGGFGGGSSPAGQGATVVGLLGTGPAAQAGIATGDVITSVAGHAVTSGESLTNVMLGQRPGQRVPVVFTDTNGQQQTVTVILASGPPQ